MCFSEVSLRPPANRVLLVNTVKRCIWKGSTIITSITSHWTDSCHIKEFNHNIPVKLILHYNNKFRYSISYSNRKLQRILCN